MGFWRRRGVVLYKVRTYKYAATVPRPRVILSTATLVFREDARMHGVYITGPCESPKGCRAAPHLTAATERLRIRLGLAR